MINYSILISLKGSLSCGKTSFLLKYIINLNEDEFSYYDLNKIPRENQFAYEFYKKDDDFILTEDDRNILKFQDVEIIENNKNFEGTDIVLIMFDVNNKDSWTEAKSLIHNCKVDKDKIILIGNKSDSISINKDIFETDIKNYLKNENLNMPYFEISCFKPKRDASLLYTFETKLRETVKYKARKIKQKLEKDYKYYIKASKELSYKTFEQFINKLYSLIRSNRNELRDKFNENEKNSYDLSSIKDENLLILLALSIQGSLDNYESTKNKCDKCQSLIQYENMKILISACNHLYCKPCMIKFCKEVTNGSMLDKDFKSIRLDKNCSICAGDGIYTEIKFLDAYKCGEFKLENQNNFDMQAYENGKSNISNYKEEVFKCQICNKSKKETDKYTAASCCFGEFCSACRELIVKSQFLRARDNNSKYKCSICKAEEDINIAGELLGFN